jgi:hypothetical protein
MLKIDIVALNDGERRNAVIARYAHALSRPDTHNQNNVSTYESI